MRVDPYNKSEKEFESEGIRVDKITPSARTSNITQGTNISYNKKMSDVIKNMSTPNNNENDSYERRRRASDYNISKNNTPAFLTTDMLDRNYSINDEFINQVLSELENNNENVLYKLIKYSDFINSEPSLIYYPNSDEVRKIILSLTKEELRIIAPFLSDTPDELDTDFLKLVTYVKELMALNKKRTEGGYDIYSDPDLIYQFTVEDSKKK